MYANQPLAPPDEGNAKMESTYCIIRLTIVMPLKIVLYVVQISCRRMPTGLATL